MNQSSSEPAFAVTNGTGRAIRFADGRTVLLSMSLIERFDALSPLELHADSPALAAHLIGHDDADDGVAVLDIGAGMVHVTVAGAVSADVSMPTAWWNIHPAGAIAHAVMLPDDAIQVELVLDEAPTRQISDADGSSFQSRWRAMENESEAADRMLVAFGGTDATPLVPPSTTTPGATKANPAPQPPTPPLPPPDVLIDLAAPLEVTPTPPLPVSAATSSGAPAASSGSVPDQFVLGIRCPQDHHNHPDAPYCSQCGRKMGVNATARFVDGLRPPLGVFVLDGGSTIAVAADLVIGREPHTASDVIALSHQPVVLTDPALQVSRHHLRVDLVDWDVTVTDLGSGNGTVVIAQTSGLESRLTAHESRTIKAGDRVRVGSRTMQLELHHAAD